MFLHKLLPPKQYSQNQAAKHLVDVFVLFIGRQNVWQNLKTHNMKLKYGRFLIPKKFNLLQFINKSRECKVIITNYLFENHALHLEERWNVCYKDCSGHSYDWRS